MQWTLQSCNMHWQSKSAEQEVTRTEKAKDLRWMIHNKFENDSASLWGLRVLPVSLMANAA